MIIDDITGKIRRGNIQDAVRMYQLAETCDLYASVNPGIVDPGGQRQRGSVYRSNCDDAEIFR